MRMNAIATRDEAVVPSLLDLKTSVANFAWGTRLSVGSSEALPFSQRAQSLEQPRGFGGLDGAVFHPSVCDTWGAPP